MEGLQKTLKIEDKVLAETRKGPFQNMPQTSPLESFCSSCK